MEMRTTVCLLVLMLVGFGASATVGGIKQPRIIVFVDDESSTYVYPASIRKEADKAVMWSLVTYKQPQATDIVDAKFLSEKSQDEYDCGTKQFRILSLYFYRGRMGAGEAVFKKLSAGEWQAIEPNSDIEILWRVACGTVNIRTLRVTPPNWPAGD